MIDIYHNILWSKYKGGVFSALNALTKDRSIDVHFYQVATTEKDRVGLSGVDLSYHNYPYELLFDGSYDQIPKLKLAATLFLRVFHSPARLVLLPGYHKPEFWSMLLAAMLTGKKRAVFCDSTAHDKTHTLVKGLLKGVFFKQCHGYFGYGQRSREYLIQNGATPSHIYARCQAAALPHDYSPDQAFQSRGAQAPAVAQPQFLYVGRLSHEKSLDVLLQAFVKVKLQYPQAVLKLVGAGPLAQELQQQALQLELEQSVIFAGSMDVKQLAQEYARATCLVLPSRSEPWGLVVNEALSYGCPAVVSDHCGCVPELVHDHETGFVFRTDDVESLAEKMLAAPEAFSDVARTAKTCIELIGEYSPARAAQQILDGCQAILAQ